MTVLATGRSVPATLPPCSAEPDRWFDRAHRTHALATCLGCPMRQWCAQEALRSYAPWGMWAGVWIDGTHADVADRLHDIATDTLVEHRIAEKHYASVEFASERRSPLRIRSAPAVRPGSVTMAVLARSSGHCEIVSDGCRFTADAHVSRLTGGSVEAATSAADLYAACRRCVETLGTAASSAEARRLGYLLDSPAQPEQVPFYWRHARWVLFGPSGQLDEASITERTAWAS